MTLVEWTAAGFFDLDPANQTLYDISSFGWFEAGATSTGVIIDNHHLATIGWYMSDTEAKVPDGEEIFTGGWFDGTITAPASTAGEKKGRMGRFVLFMPFWKRRR